MNKQINDQIIHAVISFAILAPFAIHPNIFTGVFAGLMIGMVREFTQHDGKLKGSGTFIDLFFWGVGGAFVALLT